MKKILYISVMLLGTILSGCDTIHGVNRKAEVYSLPDFKAVVSHIKKYPEIDEVEYRVDIGGKPLTFSGIKPPDKIYYISYKGRKNVSGTIHFKKDYNGNITFNQYLLQMNSRPPQEQIDATVPVMEKIEKDLEKNFGVVGIKKNIEIDYP